MVCVMHVMDNVCAVPPEYWAICRAWLYWPGLCNHSTTPKNLLPTASPPSGRL